MRSFCFSSLRLDALWSPLASTNLEARQSDVEKFRARDFRSCTCLVVEEYCFIAI